MSGGTVVAPGAPQRVGRGRQALGVAGDVAAAVALVWALPLALALVGVLVRLAANAIG